MPSLIAVPAKDLLALNLSDLEDLQKRVVNIIRLKIGENDRMVSQRLTDITLEEHEVALESGEFGNELETIRFLYKGNMVHIIITLEEDENKLIGYYSTGKDVKEEYVSYPLAEGDKGFPAFLIDTILKVAKEYLYYKGEYEGLVEMLKSDRENVKTSKAGQGMVDKTRLEVILGPMFSGKSTEMLRRVNRYRYRKTGNRILIINHTLDKRPSPIDGSINGDSVQTHCGQRQDAIKTSRLMTILDLVGSHDVIGIDEAQFFPDLLEFVKVIEPLGKVVVVAGLDGDFERKPFGQILQLIPLCDEVTKLTAMAVDGSPAIFTKRITEAKEQTLVGASEAYVAVSRQGYFS